MGRILAIDFGLKRTGLAITDELNIIASPLETIESSLLMKRLQELIALKSVDTIVLGEPKNLNNTATNITGNVHLLFEALQKQFPTKKVVLLDERFTSSMALKSMIAGGTTKKQRQEKGALDRISAAIILQSYLDQLGR